jgi:hypothetical protein
LATSIKISENQLLDESYLSKSAQLQLYLQLSNWQLQAALFDPAAHRYVGFIEYSFQEKPNPHQFRQEVENLLKKDIFSKKYQRIVVTLANESYTTVPLPLFTEEAAPDYLQLNLGVDTEVEKVKTDKINELEMALIYSMPNALESVLKNSLPPFQLFHNNALLLEALSAHPARNSQELFCVNVRQEVFEIVYFKHKKLQFLNSFPFHTTEDFIYYLLFVMEQLGIPREQGKVYLTGQIDRQSSIFEALYKYILTPVLMESNRDISFSKPLSKLPEHYYFTLFNQYLCA